MDKQWLNELLVTKVLDLPIFDYHRDAERALGPDYTDMQYVTRNDKHRLRLHTSYSAQDLNLLTWEGMGLVVAKMKEKGFTFHLKDAVNASETIATFEGYDDDYEPVRGDGTDDEAPVAAGLAALKALNVEVE